MLKRWLRWCLTKLYKVELKGAENINDAGDRVIVVANHTSFLDALLLWAFLPMELTFAINTQIHKQWYVRLIKGMVHMFALDPVNPLSLRSLVRRLRQGGAVVIFPEGRITVTGALMKIYQGPGLVALKADAQILPVTISGAMYTPFSRMRGKVRLSWFPKITLTVFSPRMLDCDDNIRGRQRREQAGKLLSDIMTETVFNAGNHDATLFQRLLDARQTHGGGQVIVEDILRQPLNYNDLILRSLLLGEKLSEYAQAQERVGILLPNMGSCVVTFWALQAYARVPAMLNFTAGGAGLVAAAEVGQLKTVITARLFIEKAKLEDSIAALSAVVRIVYLEDIAKGIGLMQKLSTLPISRIDAFVKKKARVDVQPDDAAVVLFTSGTEGLPKGVVLSHRNLLSNIQQVAARFDFTSKDVVLSTLPLFHSFGLTGCCLLPILNGVKSFYYPTPLHYRVIPEVAYDINATVIFGTNTFLAGYGRVAHPYDFYSVRFVFAGAEKLQADVRKLWEEKFGIRVFEGYGATECSPVIACNSPMDYRAGTVGRLMPGMEYQFESVPGLEQGQRLHVKGPNVMNGYLLADKPGELVPPSSCFGQGWYDTGDIVTITDGFVSIEGRAKRFAKIGGEMISLAAVEAMCLACWPDSEHVAMNFPDERKGEVIVVLTTAKEVKRAQLSSWAREQGHAELQIPKSLVFAKSIPLLGSGKVDYQAVRGEIESKR